jgi:hypothetical protein
MSVDSIDQGAPVIARHGTVIAAPLDVVWRLHVAVNAWPTWQKGIDRAHIDGALRPGAVFDWETYGLNIESTVYRVEPDRHTLWGGPSEGISGIHSWTFTPLDGGVRVDTEESWSGDPIQADTAGMQAALDASLTAWLEYLKAAAEGQ